MDHKTRKAVPTEWNGIVFRSKSEACFAMYLDHHRLRWEYEPPELTLECGYVPDFRVINYSTQTRRFSAWLIEYKPTIATNTYLSSTLEKLAILSNQIAMDCICVCMTGSFWENDELHKPRQYGMQHGELASANDWLRGNGDEWLLRKKISQHRFDLVSELSAWKEHLHG